MRYSRGIHVHRARKTAHRVVAVGTQDALLRNLEFSEVIRALGGICHVERHDGLVRSI
jgi:hypothetical protein